MATMTAAIRTVLRDAASFCFRIGSLCSGEQRGGWNRGGGGGGQIDPKFLVKNEKFAAKETFFFSAKKNQYFLGGRQKQKRYAQIKF